MRDCDDYSDEKIRLYMRVLRRMIILTALIVTIPVMMWTITALAPGYVAILQHVASTVSPSVAPTQTQTASVRDPRTMEQFPLGADAEASSDGHPLRQTSPVP